MSNRADAFGGGSFAGTSERRGPTLALGLNATVFTVVEAMLFRALPLAKRSARVVQAVGPVHRVVRTSRRGDRKRIRSLAWPSPPADPPRTPLANVAICSYILKNGINWHS